MYILDNQSICQAVNKYSDCVFRIAFFHTQNSADAEDVTQDAFLALMKRPFLKDEAHLKAWLIRVAVNKCKDLLKSAARRKTVGLEAAATKFKLNDDDLGVIECLNKLPALERDIIILHYLEGFSAKEVGSIVGKKEGAVHMRLKRIRIKLKDMLEE